VGAKPNIILTMTDHDPSPSMLVQEVSGLLAGNTTAMADGTPGAVQSSGTTSPASPAYTSTSANEYLVILYGDQGGGVTWTNPSGYTGDANGINGSGNADIQIAYKNSTGGAESGAYTLSGTVAYGIILGAFKLPGGGVTVTAGAGGGTGAALNPSVVISNVLVGPRYAGGAADLGGGSGSWGTPQYAEGGP
jgi:hypothetical protein